MPPRDVLPDRCRNHQVAQPLGSQVHEGAVTSAEDHVTLPTHIRQLSLTDHLLLKTAAMTAARTNRACAQRWTEWEVNARQPPVVVMDNRIFKHFMSRLEMRPVIGDHNPII